MKTLSVKQPWAYLLVSGIKDIENRTWKTSYRGRVFIHASASKWNEDIYKTFSFDQVDKIVENGLHETLAGTRAKGAIIGSVEIVDCVQNHPSVWAEKGVYNWIIARPIMFANPQPEIKGKLGLWDFDNTKGILDLTRVEL